MSNYRIEVIPHLHTTQYEYTEKKTNERMNEQEKNPPKK